MERLTPFSHKKSNQNQRTRAPSASLSNQKKKKKQQSTIPIEKPASHLIPCLSFLLLRKRNGKEKKQKRLSLSLSLSLSLCECVAWPCLSTKSRATHFVVLPFGGKLYTPHFHIHLLFAVQCFLGKCSSIISCKELDFFPFIVDFVINSVVL